MQLKISNKMFKKAEPQIYAEGSAPAWLTGENSVPRSTMDCRWFWKEHVLPLNVGESVDTDFSTITRIK